MSHSYTAPNKSCSWLRTDCSCENKRWIIRIAASGPRSSARWTLTSKSTGKNDVLAHKNANAPIFQGGVRI